MLLALSGAPACVWGTGTAFAILLHEKVQVLQHEGKPVTGVGGQSTPVHR